MSPFQHEALFYDGPDGFAAGAAPFVRDGVRAGEPVMVAVGAPAAERLKAELGPDADAVRFVDMATLGRNPGRIIPAWQEFLDEHGASRPVRGIGEPVWAGRRSDELVEAQLHEALLNVAFEHAADFRLLCPYDRTSLPDGVLHEACASHPSFVEAGGRRPSAAYRGHADLLAPFEAPLPAPVAHPDVLAFDRTGLSEVRAAVATHSTAAGMPPERREDLVLAVGEVAANSVLHGGGNGVLRLWRTEDALVCEIRDRGRIADPLAGRRRPARIDDRGWGLYLAHQVCDLVQLRSDDGGTVVRLHMTP